MHYLAPGLNLLRLRRLMEEAIERCHLDLAGYSVLTEAASGAYVVTPVIAAMAGAYPVFAITRTTAYGTFDEISDNTLNLARIAGVAERIEVIADLSKDILAGADIITNSGHVRPIDWQKISLMKKSAVVALMYEAWEFRSTDLDVEACRDRGIRVVGTNERHPAVDVFSFLGPMGVKLLLDAGVAVYSTRILLVCNNPFNDFIKAALQATGAMVDCVEALRQAPLERNYDAVLVARTPSTEPALSDDDVLQVRNSWPGAVIAVFWGDLDRGMLQNAGLHYWPKVAPVAGHMGILPSSIGPEPIVRLQSGSLKAAEAQLRHGGNSRHPDHTFRQLI